METRAGPRVSRKFRPIFTNPAPGLKLPTSSSAPRLVGAPSFSSDMSGLNQPQRAAIHSLDGPCLVLAGAGSGKTRVITQKIAYLVNDCGFNPHAIAAITFTNKAAKEMLERISKLMGGRAAKGLTVCTFHALGVRIVRQEAQLLGLKPQFSILDAGDTTQIIAEMTGNTDKNRAKALQWQISSWHTALVEPNEAAHRANDEISSAAALLYRDYDKTLRA